MISTDLIEQANKIADKNKVCSIAGMHTHYICKTCKYHWIFKRSIPNNPISEI